MKPRLACLALALLSALVGAAHATVVTAYHVPTNADLAGTDPGAYATSDYGNGIWRDTFRTGSKAAPLFFFALIGGNCSAYGYVNDGGQCVDYSGGGKAWVSQPIGGVRDPTQFG